MGPEVGQLRLFRWIDFCMKDSHAASVSVGNVKTVTFSLTSRKTRITFHLNEWFLFIWVE